MKRFAGTLPHPALSEATLTLDGTTVRFGDLSADCTGEDVVIHLYGAPGFPPIGTVVRFGAIAIGGRDVVLPDALTPPARLDMNVAAFLERDAFIALMTAIADARETALASQAQGYRERVRREERSRWEPVVPTRFPIVSPHSVGLTPGSMLTMLLAAPAACGLAYATHSLTGNAVVAAALGLATMLGAIAIVATSSRAQVAAGLFEETLSIEGDDLVYRRGSVESRRSRASVLLERRYSRVARSSIRYPAISIVGLAKHELLIGVSDPRFAWRQDADITSALPRWAWPCMWAELLRTLELADDLELRPDAWKKK